MAKMRVHELAKELNIKSQDVIDTLNGTQFAVKNVQNGLEDEAQQIVRKKYAKTEVKKDVDIPHPREVILSEYLIKGG